MKSCSPFFLLPFFFISALVQPLYSSELLSAFQPGQEVNDGWKVGGKAGIESDAEERMFFTGGDRRTAAWVLSERDFSGNYRIEALVQLVPSGEGKGTRWSEMSLSWGAEMEGDELTVHREVGYTGDKLKGYRLRVVTQAEKKTGQGPEPDELVMVRTAPEPNMEGVPRVDRVIHLEPFRMLVEPSYTPDDISPVWDEQFRLAAEQNYARLPLTGDVWAKITVEVTPEWARVYRNGLFFQEFPTPPATSGRVLALIPAGVRLASLTVSKSNPVDEQFYPIPLDEIVNERGEIQSESLPEPMKSKVIAGVPFLFPPRDDRGDHVDIGKSLFGFREATGSYDSFSSGRVTWRSASTLDSGRIMLRVPNRAYGRLWVVAAAGDEPSTLPILTVRFFKPLAGFAVDAEKEIPELTATGKNAEARRIKVKTRDGKEASLWVVPIDLDTAGIASSFRGKAFLNMELTKKVHDFRASPDPVSYDAFQGGLPSSVRVYAATLEEAPFVFRSDGTRVGKTYVSPERPEWAVDVENLSGTDQELKVVLEVSGPDGFSQRLEKATGVKGGKAVRVKFSPKPEKFGHYTVRTTVSEGDTVQFHDGAFLFLPPDERKATAKTSRWGLWYWTEHDVHLNHEDNLKILHAIGARTGARAPYELRKKYDIGPASKKVSRARQPWAMDSPDDPAARAAYVEEAVKTTRKHLEEVPDLEYLLPYAEQIISLRISHGVPPFALGEPPFEYNKTEAQRKKAFIVQAQAANEGVKQVSENIDVMLGSCSAVFAIPLMEAGVSKETFDGIGLDLPQFERMPERQPRATEPSLLYFNKEARERLGYADKPYHHFESYFPSSHPLAVGERGHAQSIVRTAVLSMALGTERFIECWGFQDASDYWGSSHYSNCAMFTRQPEFNPKPGAGAYATMTQVLDTARYDGYLPTGSWSSYCVRFKDPDKLVYAMWTFNGTRPATVFVSTGTELVKVDEGGNKTPVAVKEGTATLDLSPTPFWLIARGGEVDKIELGEPVYAPPTDTPTVLLENFKGEDWTYSSEPYPEYAENHWDVRRLPGEYTFSFEDSAERGGKVLKASLTKAGEGPLVGWYGVFTPPKPIDIPGKASALGIWAKGNSGWGRVIYELEDANGQKLRNIGNKDQFNCDDIHSWSYLNFDGWKYMEFPLPGNLPGDNYREKNSVWWGHSERNPVSLPLKLTRIIVEMPTHIVYINDLLEVNGQSVELSDLVAVYDSEEMKSDLPVKIQRANQGLFHITKADGSVLPNPIQNLLATGTDAITEIDDVLPPEAQNDGTRARVSLKPVKSAKSYKIWVSAYPDGAGAKEVRVTPSEDDPSNLLVRGLAASVPLYLFATSVDQEGRESKPSSVRKVILKDEFPFK